MTKSEIMGMAPIGRIRFLAYTNLAFLLLILGSFLGLGSVIFGGEIFPIEDLFIVKSVIEYSLFLLAIVLIFKFSIQRFVDLGLKGFAVVSYLTPLAPITYLALALIPSSAFAKDKTPKSKEPNMQLKLLAILPLIVIVPTVILGVLAFISY